MLHQLTWDATPEKFWWNRSRCAASTLRSHCAVIVFENWEMLSSRPRPLRGGQLHKDEEVQG